MAAGVHLGGRSGGGDYFTLSKIMSFISLFIKYCQKSESTTYDIRY